MAPRRGLSATGSAANAQQPPADALPPAGKAQPLGAKLMQLLRSPAKAPAAGDKENAGAAVRARRACGELDRSCLPNTSR